MELEKLTGVEKDDKLVCVLGHGPNGDFQCEDQKTSQPVEIPASKNLNK